MGKKSACMRERLVKMSSEVHCEIGRLRQRLAALETKRSPKVACCRQEVPVASIGKLVSNGTGSVTGSATLVASSLTAPDSSETCIDARYDVTLATNAGVLAMQRTGPVFSHFATFELPLPKFSPNFTTLAAKKYGVVSTAYRLLADKAEETVGITGTVEGTGSNSFRVTLIPARDSGTVSLLQVTLPQQPDKPSQILEIGVVVKYNTADPTK